MQPLLFTMGNCPLFRFPTGRTILSDRQTGRPALCEFSTNALTNLSVYAKFVSCPSGVLPALWLRGPSPVGLDVTTFQPMRGQVLPSSLLGLSSFLLSGSSSGPVWARPQGGWNRPRNGARAFMNDVPHLCFILTQSLTY